VVGTFLLQYSTIHEFFIRYPNNPYFRASEFSLKLGKTNILQKRKFILIREATKNSWEKPQVWVPYQQLAAWFPHSKTQ